MTVITAQELYELLPAVHRVRDAELGYPLQAMIGVLADQADALAQDIDGLYANWFIETCDEWAVPYIGDLLRVRRLNTRAAGMSERSYVANTLRYRRRKGTVSVIERLAFDVTGWRAKALETFKLLGATQNINHVRGTSFRTPNLRLASDLELVNGPFETSCHSVDVRRIEPRRGRYNIPDIAVMLWRLQAYPVSGATAQPVSDPPDGRYWFNPLGRDEPLFNTPQTEAELAHLATEVDIPGPLRPRALHDDLPNQPSLYFAPGNEVFKVEQLVAKGGAAVSAGALSICDLADWQRPVSGVVAVDPARGRLSFPTGTVPPVVSVSYSYGFSADVGAGTYDRTTGVSTWLDRRSATPAGASQDPATKPTWLAAVIQDDALRSQAPDPSVVFPTLAAAITEWNTQTHGSFGVICLMDSRSYAEWLPTVSLPPTSRLGIVAATARGLVEAGATTTVEPKSLMPVIEGTLAVTGVPSQGQGSAAGELFIDGLLIKGQIGVNAGDLGLLSVASSTVTGGIVVDTTTPDDQSGIRDNSRLRLTVTACMTGPIFIAGQGGLSGVSVADCVVDAAGGTALDAANTDLTVNTTTVFGTTTARTLDASDSLFNAPLSVERLQAGCVRFSYVPDGSVVPFAYRCQPAMALAAAPPDQAGAVRAGLEPMFKSQRLGDPGYAQLLLLNAPELLTGADNGGEMGAFNQVQQPHREANLRTALDEYLRFGLEAGIFYVN